MKEKAMLHKPPLICLALVAAAILVACGTSTGAFHKIQVHTPLSCPCPTIAPLAKYPLPADQNCTQSQNGCYFGSLAVGSDGNVWVAEYDSNEIGRVNVAAGTVTEFPLPTSTAFPVPTSSVGPDMIAPGPDGNLWFLEANVGTIGRITTVGAITEFPLPPPLNGAMESHGYTGGITAGPDGNLWFVHSGANAIGVISTSGTLLHTYPIPTANSAAGFIVKGPDGNLWFTEQDGNNIGRVRASDGLITEFSIPTANSGPRNIITGPDGNLWFPEIEAGNVARITTSGVIAEFPMVADPTIHRLRSIALTPDGFMWVVNAMVAPPWDSEIGKFNTAGVEVDLWDYGRGGPRPIVAGPDGNPWFASEGTAEVIRL
jgi:virginiamycin B lyase